MKSLKKKVLVDDLKIGMFVADLGVKWLDHPFLRQKFVINDESIIREIRDAGIHEVYIDTAKGIDANHAPTEDEVRDTLEAEMLQLFADLPQHQNRTTAHEELHAAQLIKNQACEVIRNVMQDARLGEQIELERIEPVVERISTSILRNENALMTLCRIKDKDTYTFTHSVSVCTLLISFCRAMDIHPDEARVVGVGGLLHDIGKTRVPHRILNKMGKLSDREFQVMKGHVDAGRQVLESVPGINPISIQVAYEHHERFDGTGYPEGKAANAISRIGQMAAICDVYDAITSARIYHSPLAAHEALSKMLEWGKYHFDMPLVHAFIRTVGIYPVGTLVLLESGKVGVVLDHSTSNLLRPIVRVFYDKKKSTYISPFEVDLSRNFGAGGGDRILQHEIPETLGVNPLQFM